MASLPPAPALGSSPLLSIWRQRVLFAVVFSSIFAIAVIALLVLPARYQAVGSVIVAEPESGLALPPAGWAQKVGDPADIESQLLVVRSPRVLRMVADAPGIMETIQTECGQSKATLLPVRLSASCDRLTADSPETLDYLQTRYSIGGAGRSRIINIGYTSSDPATAQIMANALINAFLEDHREGLSGGRAVAMAGLANELTRLDEQIRKDDASIQDFRSKKGLMNGASAPFASERLSSVSAQLSAAETARSKAASVLTAGRASDASSLPSFLQSRTVADLQQQVSAASQEAAAAAITLGPRHPRLRTLQGQIAVLQKRLAAEMANVVDSAQEQYDAADRLVTSLRAELETAKAQVSTSTGDETSIEQMVRDVGIKREQYAKLSEQRKQLESEQHALIGSTRLVSLAEKPLTKFFPKTLPFVAGGFVLALVAGAAASLLRDRALDRHVDARPRRRAAKPEAPDLAVLARLPQLSVDGGSGGLADMPAILKAAETDKAMQAALRTLLAEIQRAGSPKKHVSVLLASAFPGQGKTFAALALARFAAKAGAKVLVIECDMREPVMQRLFDLRPAAGLASILEGRCAPQQAIAKIDGIDVLAAGTAGSDPIDLLAGRRMSELLDWAQLYDLVILDSPALDRQMDAGLIARHVDGLVLCSRGDKGALEPTATVASRLSTLGARVFGAVMTGGRGRDGLRGRLPRALTASGAS